MAEVIGLVASIITIAQSGASIATTLGKLSVKLKHAGREAKDISRKVRLVTKVLEQIEIHLNRDPQSIDLSLVEDYVILCEERVAEARRLAEVLETEMNSSSTWDHIVFRIRFLLEKSTFTLLRQDMDSLHLTLDLYVTTLVYTQVRENASLLEEIREKLQEVEDDLKMRTVGASVNAAVFTVQFNQLFAPPTSSLPSRSGGSDMIVEEVDSDNGDDKFDTRDRSSDHSVALPMSQGDPRLPTGGQSVPLDVLENDAVSNALVVFAQIQMVQKKTVRRVNQELKDPPDLAHLSTTVDSKGLQSYVATADPLVTETLSKHPKKREALADEYAGRTFTIINCQTSKAVHFNFVAFSKLTLRDMVLDTHSLRQPAELVGSAAMTVGHYQPQQFPMRLAIGSVEDDGRRFQISKRLFASYVISYAQKHTDFYKSVALKNDEYNFRFTKRTASSTATWPDDLVPFGREYDRLEPGVVVNFEFFSRELTAENMISVRDEMTGEEWMFVSEGPHVDDLRRLPELGGYQVRSLSGPTT